MPRADQAGETLEAAVIRALNVGREAAAGELPVVQVITEALAAEAVSFAARVGALTEPRITRLFAFHSLGVVTRDDGVNSH